MRVAGLDLCVNNLGARYVDEVADKLGVASGKIATPEIATMYCSSIDDVAERLRLVAEEAAMIRKDFLYTMHQQLHLGGTDLLHKIWRSFQTDRNYISGISAYPLEQ